MAEASPRSDGAQGQRPKRVPLRTCVACRSTQPKRGLVRIVRAPEGTVRLDETGRSQGRGAYLHLDPACMKEGMRKGRLGHALRTTISAQDQTTLEDQLQHILPVEDGKQDA